MFERKRLCEESLSIRVMSSSASVTRRFSVSGELGQREALQEPDRGAYWPEAATPREPSLNRCGRLIPRDDEKLVRVVDELQAEANGHCAELKVVSIPDDVQWEIRKTDGREHVSQVHRIWE